MHTIRTNEWVKQSVKQTGRQNKHNNFCLGITSNHILSKTTIFESNSDYEKSFKQLLHLSYYEPIIYVYLQDKSRGIGERHVRRHARAHSCGVNKTKGSLV